MRNDTHLSQHLTAERTTMSFAGKVAIVTGAASGIGAATALKFCEEGAQVSLVDRNQSDLQLVLEKCQKTSGAPHAIAADLTSESDVQRVVEETLKQFGKIDILVNSAGVGAAASVFDDDVMQKYERAMAINLRAVVHLTSACAPHLVETKGNLVNISSVMSTVPTNIGLAYATSKAALDNFTRCVALELAAKGVRANTVSPGPANTNIMKNMGLPTEREQEVWDRYRKGAALGRICEPEEIADLILFVASDKARSITGASLVADNGTILRSRSR